MDARWYGNDGTMDFLQPPWNSPAVAMDAARRCGDGRWRSYPKGTGPVPGNHCPKRQPQNWAASTRSSPKLGNLSPILWRPTAATL
jgi:hypothetical protein